MKTREFLDIDVDRVAAIHRQMGLDYRLPDFHAPMIAARTICEHDGEVIGASILKMQAETYLWIKPGASPQVKWDAIRMMQRDIVRQAMKLGIEQLVAYVPDCVNFRKRLKSLKWDEARDGFRAWVYEVLS